MSKARDLANFIGSGELTDGTLEINDVDGLQAVIDAKLSTDGDGSGLSGINAVSVGTSLPAQATSQGSLFYVTTTGYLYISDGSDWELVANSSPTTTGGTVVIPAVNEITGVYSYDLGTDFSDDSDTASEITYTLQLGTLPTGCSLPTQGNTAFTGTATAVTSSVTYNFVIKATDSGGATSSQSYQWSVTNKGPLAAGGVITLTSVTEGVGASHSVESNYTYTAGSTPSTYAVQSGSLPSGLTLNSSTGAISGTMGDVDSDTSYSFTVRVTDTEGYYEDQSYGWTILRVPPPVGEDTYTSAGTYTWTAPAGSEYVSVVCVGGGGSNGGGGLGWKNDISVVEGNSYTVVVGSAGNDSYFISAATVKGGGASGDTGGSYTGDGGGNGGTCPGGTYPGGGGGGGYAGTGGAGASYGGGGSAGTGGAGGGGGGGQHGYRGGSGSGGVGIIGQSSSGNGGGMGSGGYGGSGGGNGQSGNASGGINPGGLYGGNQRNGAVRIIYGPSRSYPTSAS